MRKIAVAFTWSLIMSVLAGGVFGFALHRLDIDWLWGPGFTVSITVIHGWIQSREMLLKALGQRDRPAAYVSGRAIPVTAGGMAAKFESAIRSGTSLNLEMDNRLSIVTPTGVEMGPDEIKHFIGRAWTRQLTGKPPLSRRYWTKRHRPPMDRERYESIIYVLRSEGAIAGRVGGKSGYLVADYKTIINAIKRG